MAISVQGAKKAIAGTKIPILALLVKDGLVGLGA